MRTFPIKNRRSWKRTRLIAATGLLILLALPVWAGSPQPFTAPELDKFTADWPRFVTWAREHGEDFDRPQARDSIFEELLGRRATEFITSMGWDTDRFGYVLERVTALLAGLNMEEHRDKIKAAHEAERIEIENNPNLTAADRAERLAELEESWAQMEKYQALLKEASPQEMELIRARKDNLMNIIKKTYQEP